MLAEEHGPMAGAQLWSQLAFHVTSEDSTSGSCHSGQTLNSYFLTMQQICIQGPTETSKAKKKQAQ